MAGSTDVVIAGTKPFALALFAPVLERAGSRPRIAPEPAVALTLCAESSGVLVVEFEPRWLPALTLLRQQRPGLRVVAALPPGQEAAALSLEPLSIEAVPWDGKALSMLPAIERAIGSSRSAAAQTAEPKPAVAPEAAVAGSLVAPAPPPEALAGSPAAPAPPAALDLFADLGARLATPFPASLAGVKVPAPAAASASGAPLDLFHDLGGAVATPLPAVLLGVPRVASPTGEILWPATGPTAVEAERALRGALGGAAEPPSFKGVVDGVAAGLSSLEREVFTSGAASVDARPIRHAAVLRLRVAVARATLPAPGTAIDSAAVAELLSEIDGLLKQVKGLVDQAEPEVKLALESIRNALVREAIDLSDDVHRLVPSELPAEPSMARPVTGRTAAVRFLSDKAGEDQEEVTGRKRGRVVWVLLALVVLAAGAFHGYSWWKTEQVVAQMKRLPGQPERMMLLPAPPGATTRELVPMGGVPDRAEVEHFKSQQRALGNTVTETSLGWLVIKPAAPPPAEPRGSKP
jgi:hypothetical protein